jgi:hypothetical protein
MLVIGIGHNKHMVSHDLPEIDPNSDTPQAIHDALKEATKVEGGFEIVLCVDDDELLASYIDKDDYNSDEENADDDNDPAEIDFNEIIGKHEV